MICTICFTDLDEQKKRARVHFIPNRKVKVVATHRAPDIMKSPEGREEVTNIKALKAKLVALPAQIEEIELLEVGINFLEANAAYDLVLVSEFKRE